MADIIPAQPATIAKSNRRRNRGPKSERKTINSFETASKNQDIGEFASMPSSNTNDNKSGDFTSTIDPTKPHSDEIFGSRTIYPRQNNDSTHQPNVPLERNHSTENSGLKESGENSIVANRNENTPRINTGAKSQRRHRGNIPPPIIATETISENNSSNQDVSLMDRNDTVNRKVPNNDPLRRHQFSETKYRNQLQSRNHSSGNNDEITDNVIISDSRTRAKKGNNSQRNRNPRYNRHENTSLNPAAPAFVPSSNPTLPPPPPTTLLEPALSNVVCTICAEENVLYLAVGPCNHPICSICSLRIRFKTKSFDCPICKSLMNVVVVFSQSRSDSSFQSFALPDGDEWTYTSSPFPGTALLPLCKMIFFDCSSHLKSLEKLISIACPLANCGQRFPSNKRLLDHLNEQHLGMTMCSICLENRQLFISEHRVVTKAELKQHMNGSKAADSHKGPADMISTSRHVSKDVKDEIYFTAGHPKCEFCKSHHFDSAALYSHMQSTHETCHLCPGRMMFRYYRNLASLHQHFRSNHIICENCFEVEERRLSGEAVAFNTYNDYSAHMMDYHGVSARDCRMRFEQSLRRGATFTTAASGRSYQDSGFFDLDMGTANPYSNTANSTSNQNTSNSNNNNNSSNSTNNSNRKNNEASGPNPIVSRILNSATATSDIISIPSNMQIAGRVSGSGRFYAKSESDLLMQSLAQERSSAIQKEHAIMNQWGLRNISQPESFPQLSASVPTASDTDNAVPQAPDVTPHPLSLVHTRQLQKKTETISEVEKERNKELETRKVVRRRALLDALSTVHDEDDAGSWRRQPISNSTAESLTESEKAVLLSLSHICGEEQIGNIETSKVLHVLWPPQLLNWGQANRPELVKLEHRLQDLLADKRTNSVQVKPMDKFRRDMVHWISRFYQTRSYEYEPEPKRYVSLVKSPQSSVPYPLLSQAARQTQFIPPNPSLVLLPAIYFHLKNAVPTQPVPPQSFEVLGAGRATPGCGIFTVAEVISKIRNFLKLDYMLTTRVQPADSLDILRAGQVGPGTVEFTFRSLKAAAEAYKTIMAAFNPSFSLLKAEAGSREYTAGQLAQYFEVIPGFSPSQENETENLSSATASAIVDYSNSNSNDNRGEVILSQQSYFNRNESSGEASSWTRVLPAKGASAKSAAAAVSASVGGANVTAVSAFASATFEEEGQLDDSFVAQLGQQDEWDEFLSLKRSSVETQSLYSAERVISERLGVQYGSRLDLPLAVALAVEAEEHNAVLHGDASNDSRGQGNTFSVLGQEEEDVDQWEVYDPQEFAEYDADIGGQEGEITSDQPRDYDNELEAEELYGSSIQHSDEHA